MGIWRTIKSTLHKTIQKVKHIELSAGKLIGNAAHKAESAVKTVYNDAKEIVTALLKTINTLFTSPTFLIGAGIVGIGAITVLPKLIK